jgi:uncharacterized delta-60 repeat protein
MPNSRSRTFERLGDAQLAGASLEGQTALRLGEVTKEIGDGASVGTGNGGVGIGGGVEIGVQGAPLLTGIPGIAQFVHVGRATALADIVVAHAGDAELTVTLEVLDGLGRVGGVLGGLTDGDDGAPGIQLSGTAAEISAALSDATFTADAVGQGHLQITVNDGHTSAISHYAFTAVQSPVKSAPTFAVPTGSGKLMVPVGSGSASAFSVALQPDGKIVVAGASFSGGHSDISLIRLHSNGSLDVGFGNGGKQLLDVDGREDYAHGVTLQPDGKIVVAGQSTNASGRPEVDFSLIRLNANGSLDGGFGEEGKMLLDLDGRNGHGRSVALQPDGKILMAGFSIGEDGNAVFSLIRLSADGNLDEVFGDQGKQMVDVSGDDDDKGHSVVLQPDGKILVAGYSGNDSNNDFSLIRLNIDGSLDEGFGEGGKLVLLGSGKAMAYSVTLQADGKIVMAGYGNNGVDTDFGVIRLNADGSLDTGFGEGGKLLLPVGSRDDVGRSITVQPDGKIVVAGYSDNGINDDFSLIRLNLDGSLDKGFGESGTGMLVMPAGNSSDQAFSVTLQDDGKIVVGGRSFSGGNEQFYLIRLNADGSLDTTFNPSTSPVDSLGGTASYSKNGLPVVLDGTAEVFDAELAAQGHYAGTSLTLARNGGAHAQDMFGASGALVLTDDGGVELSGIRIGSHSQVEGQLAVTFNTQATQARVNQALSSLTYANTSDAPPASVRIDWSFDDGSDMPPASGSTLVSIAPVNDAPMLAGVPAEAQAVTVGLAAALADFTVSDNDGDDMTLTLTAVNGALKGLDDSDPDADGIQLSGTAAQINAAIAGATFTAAAAGAASIELELSDGAESVTQSYLLTATAPPRPPAPQPPAPQPPAPQPPAPPPAPPVPPPATPGIDVVHYAGARDDYVLQRNDAGLWSLRTASGSSATPLPGMERLVFDDGAVALDLAGAGPNSSAAQAARLVFALWGRAGLDSPALVGHVMAYVDALGLGAASQVAENLGLLTALAGDAEPAALLTLLHTHVVGHAPDAAQLQALMELPASGHSNAQLLQIAAELAVTAQAMDLDALARKGLEFTPYEGPVFGSGGNEVFLAQQRDDRIDAGAGLDTVVYVGNAADYAWSRGDQGQWIVQSSAHDGGRDPLQGVERLRFADHAVALDLNGAAGQALRMLGAVLGAQALDDRALVGELLAYVDAHGAQALADGVQANGTLDRLAGGDSPQALITLLYRNVMQHAPDQAELDWALDLAAQQDWNRADLLLQMAALPQAAQLIDLDGLAAQGVAYAVWELERAPV